MIIVARGEERKDTGKGTGQDEEEYMDREKRKKRKKKRGPPCCMQIYVAIRSCLFMTWSFPYN